MKDVRRLIENRTETRQSKSKTPVSKRQHAARTWHGPGPKIPDSVASELDGFEEESLPAREDALLRSRSGVQIVISPCCSGNFGGVRGQ